MAQNAFNATSFYLIKTFTYCFSCVMTAAFYNRPKGWMGLD